MNEDRLDPDEILKAIQQTEKKENLGALKIFFGMSAGVGKTYAMLEEGHQRLKEGVNVFIGVINTHKRQETEKLVEGLPIIPEKWIQYKDKAFQELDLEKILELKPQLVLIDEFAHTNVPGSKHPKRWQDVVEILDAGIDVYTTLNVQHLESRKDLVESITGIQVHETVPDLILERATAIEIVDIPPSELLKRLKEGKVYLGDQSVTAAQNFFQEDHLTALREIALRFTAEKVDHDLHGILALGKGWKTRERLMVGITPDNASQQLLRSARRLAFELDAPWVAVHVNTGEKFSAEDQARLNKHLQLASDMGAEVIKTNDLDIANAFLRIAKQKGITRLVIGRPRPRSFFKKMFKKSFIDRLEEENKQMDILILRQDKITNLYKSTIPSFQFTSPFSSYGIALAVTLIVSFLGFFINPYIGYEAVGYFYLLEILILSLFMGQGPVLFTAVLSSLIWDYVFIPPEFAFYIKEPQDFALISMFFITACVVGMLTNRIRERDLFLYRREEKIEQLYEFMRQIFQSSNFDQLRINLTAKLKSLFNGNFDFILKAKDNQLEFNTQMPVQNQETDRAAALWSLRTGKIAGWSTNTLPSAQSIYFPIKFSKAPSGVLLYEPKELRPLSIDEIDFLQSIAEQVGIFVERYVLEESLLGRDYTRQVEKLHDAIFRSLNKGFYTPLEKVSSLIQRLKKIADTKEEQLLIDEIVQAEKGLKMTVDNILIISRLESGFITFEKKKNSITDLIHLSLQEAQTLLNVHSIQVNLPEHDSFLDFDLNLMKMAVKNLIINAMENSPPDKPINIAVEIGKSEFKISVADEGHGISSEIIPLIFEKFYRAPEAKKEGVGLGLTIVKAVVDIHQGKMEVNSREGKGTEFSLIFPIE